MWAIWSLLSVAGDGVYPLVAVAEAKADEAMAVVRSATGAVPPSSVRPRELEGRILGRADLVAAESVRLPAGRPDHTYKVTLGGGDAGYVWTHNGKPHGQNKPLPVRQGEREWMIHSHNNYHQEGGMMLTMSYVTDRPLSGRERASPLGLVCDWLSPSVG